MDVGLTVSLSDICKSLIFERVLCNILGGSSGTCEFCGGWDATGLESFPVLLLASAMLSILLIHVKEK
jgi:hypothetical protein